MPVNNLLHIDSRQTVHVTETYFFTLYFFFKKLGDILKTILLFTWICIFVGTL